MRYLSSLLLSIASLATVGTTSAAPNLGTASDAPFLGIASEAPNFGTASEAHLLATPPSAALSPSLTHSAPSLTGRAGGESASVLSLSHLKDSALQHNLATRTARLDIAAAQEQRKEAFTNYFPNISGTALWFNANKGMAKMDIDPAEFITPELGATLAQMLPAEALTALSSPMTMTMMKNGTIAGIEAILPVFTGGQIINGNKLARLGEEVSRLKLRLSENEVEAQTEQYYWQLISLMQKERTLDAVDSLLTDLAKDAQTAVEAGVALRNDLLQVQLRQNEVQSQRLKLANGKALIRLLITQYCGLQEAWTIQSPLPASPLALKEEGGIGAADQGTDAHLTPEYQLLQKGVEAADLQYKMELGKRLPSVAVGAGYNYHNLLDNNRSFGMVFATASVPISDWWGGSHALKRKRLEQQKARQEMEDRAQLLDIRIQKALNDVAEAQSQLQLAGFSIGQAAENLRIHRDTYHAGTATMADLLQAQLLYQQACDKQTDAFIDLQKAQLSYRHATGMK